MRLLNTQTFKLQTFASTVTTPDYAILSHCWELEEVTFSDIQDLARARSHSDWKKVEGACAAARANGYDWLWIDTCCIDKSSSAELSEAINSMFSWYGRAALCVAYLGDVGDDDPNATASSFRRSRWFTRGWTLQELVAPVRPVLFLSRDWTRIGTSVDIAVLLEEITRVDLTVLLSAQPYREISKLSVARRMAWAAGRETTRPEDRAYSLMGLFNISMPILYGEGGEGAFRRLQLEIIRHTFDHSIFAWGVRASPPRIARAPERRSWIPPIPRRLGRVGTPEVGHDERQHSKPATGHLFALSPDDFCESANVARVPLSLLTIALGLGRIEEPHFFDTNTGIRICLPLCLVQSTAHGRVWYAALASKASEVGADTEGAPPPSRFIALVLFQPTGSRAFRVVEAARAVNLPYSLVTPCRFPFFSWAEPRWKAKTIYIWANYENVLPDQFPSTVAD